MPPERLRALCGWTALGSLLMAGPIAATKIHALSTLGGFVTIGAFLGWVYYKGKSGATLAPAHNEAAAHWRECIICRRSSDMRPVLRTNRGQIVLIVLLCFGIVPGLLYMAWMWGKYRCDVCGTIGRNFHAPPATD